MCTIVQAGCNSYLLQPYQKKKKKLVSWCISWACEQCALAEKANCIRACLCSSIDGALRGFGYFSLFCIYYTVFGWPCPLLSSQHMKDIGSLEQIKVKATKTVRGLEHEKTLKHSGLFSTEKKRSESGKASSSLQAAKEKIPAGF